MSCPRTQPSNPGQGSNRIMLDSSVLTIRPLCLHGPSKLVNIYLKIELLHNPYQLKINVANNYRFLSLLTPVLLINITHHFCRSVELGVHLHKNFSSLFVFSNFCITFTLPSEKKIWNPFTC